MAELGSNIAALEPSLADVSDEAKKRNDAAIAAANMKSEDAQMQADKVSIDLFDMHPKEAPIEKIPEWEDSKEYQKTKIGKQGLGAAFALFVAALAGPAFMKTGANGAMLALTAAINGWKSGRDEVMKQARDDYDKHIKYIERETARLSQRYKQEFEDETRPLQVRLKQLNLIAIQEEHHAMRLAMTWQQAVNAHVALLRSADGLKKPRAVSQTTEKLAYEEYVKKTKSEGGTPDSREVFHEKHFKGGKTPGASLPPRIGGKTPTTPDEAKAAGWQLVTKNGKSGYVSPDGKLVIPVK